MTFARQQPALIEAPRERGFGRTELRAGERDEAAVQQFGRRVRAHASFEQRRLGPIRVMPDDERAIALEKHRLGQPGQHLRPGFERCRAEPRDQKFGAGGFGKRREHGGRDPRGGLRAVGVAALIKRHAMSFSGEPPRDEAPAQTAAEHSEIGLCGAAHRARSASIRRTKAMQARVKNGATRSKTHN